MKKTMFGIIALLVLSLALSACVQSAPPSSKATKATQVEEEAAAKEEAAAEEEVAADQEKVAAEEEVAADQEKVAAEEDAAAKDEEAVGYPVKYHTPRMLFKHYVPQNQVYYSGRISDGKLWAYPYPRPTGPIPFYEVGEDGRLVLEPNVPPSTIKLNAPPNVPAPF